MTLWAVELRFTERARGHLDAIVGYIREKNPAAARSVGQRIHWAVDMLRYFSEAGPRGTAEGTREWLVRGLPYIVVYELIDASSPPW